MRSLDLLVIAGLAAPVSLGPVGTAPADSALGPDAAAGVAAAGVDTTFTVSRGDRLLLDDLDGDVTVGTWDGDRVRIRVLDERGAPVPVGRSAHGPVVHGHHRNRSIRVDAPAWLALEIRGRHLDVEIRGVRADVGVRSLSGDIRLTDVEGEITARALDGDVVGEKLAGTIRLASVDDDVRVRGARGRLSATTNDGDVILSDMELDALEAGTTDGDVEFSGTFRAGGRYTLQTHSGGIDATFPRSSDVQVDVSTFDGSFEAGFPVVLDGIRSGRGTSFTLGAGSAHLTLEAFDGDIVVRDGGS